MSLNMRSRKFSFVMLVSAISIGIAGCQPKSSGISNTTGLPPLKNPLEKSQKQTQQQEQTDGNTGSSGSAKTNGIPAETTTSTTQNNSTPVTEVTTGAENKLDSLDGLSFALKTSCAVQICGDPAKTFMPSDILGGQTVDDTSINDFYSKEMRPELEKTYALAIERLQKTLKVTDAALPRLGHVQLTKSYRALLNVFWTFSGYSAYSSALRPGKPEDNKNYVVDVEALKTLTPAMTEADRRYLVSYLEDILNSGEFSLLSAASQMPFKDLAMVLNPKVDAGQAQQALATYLLAPIQVLQKSFPELGIDLPHGLEVIIAGQVLTPELEASLSNSFSLSMIARAVTERSDLYAARAVPVADIIAEIKSSGIIEKMKAQMASPSELKDRKDKAFEQCRTIVNRSAQAALTADDLQKTQQMIGSVKSSVLKVAKNLSTSKEIQKKISIDVQKIEFNLPYSKEQMLAGLTSKAKSSTAEEAKNVARIDQFTDSAILMLMYSERNGEGVLPENSIESACNVFAPGGITDNAVSILGKINLSWQTVKLRKFSAGVIAHELGHIVSADLKDTNSSPYEAMRECTNLRHSDIDKVHDKTYLEEDFADMIASLVLKDLRTQNLVETGNFGCLLMGKSHGRWGEEMGLTMKWADDNKDSHSPNLFRTIQSNIISGQVLPEACQNIVDSHVPSAKKECSVLDTI
jgi:hypothetical protein